MFFKSSYNYNNVSNFSPNKQRGWFFYDWGSKSGDIIIDLDYSFFHKVSLSGNSTIKFIGGREGYQYIFCIQFNNNATLTFKSNAGSGLKKGVYVRIASQASIDEGSAGEVIYLAGFLVGKDNSNNYLDLIALANEFEEMGL